VKNSLRFTWFSAVVVALALPVQACTDLTENPKSLITPGSFFRTEAEVVGGVAGVYNMLRNDGTLWGYYNMSELSTDEMIVPTRGQDWKDNGRWLELHRQTWQAGSPAGLDDIERIYRDSFQGVARANVLLDRLKTVTITNQAPIEAELRTLRAFFYYLLLDDFGGVPLATDAAIMPRARVTRDSLFKFIESELLAVRADLPLTRPANEWGRIRRGVADAILASIYLNAGVYTKNTGVSATAYNSCSGVIVAAPGASDACAAAIAYSDSILNSGVYSLAANWRSNFTADNRSSLENIFVARNLNQSGLGLNFPMRALHYNQFTPSPWNGFSAVAEAYQAFDSADQRRQIFLVGQQYQLERLAVGDTVPVNDRGGSPLVFTDTIGDATNAHENEGARIMKYSIDPAHVAENNANDYVFFRLGEIYLIKAEALNEQNPGSATALGLVNALRARVFSPANPRGAIDRAGILQERLFEMTGEGKRRSDLIRHGKYTTWTEATINGHNAATENFRILLPIPQSEIDVNPLLCQNPGYGGTACP